MYLRRGFFTILTFKLLGQWALPHELLGWLIWVSTQIRYFSASWGEGAIHCYHIHLMGRERRVFCSLVCTAQNSESIRSIRVLTTVKQNRTVKWKWFVISWFPCKISFFWLVNKNQFGFTTLRTFLCHGIFAALMSTATNAIKSCTESDDWDVWVFSSFFAPFYVRLPYSHWT